MDISDLESAIEYIYSHSTAWHQERQATLQGEYIKQKYDSSKYFVMSKVSFN